MTDHLPLGDDLAYEPMVELWEEHVHKLAASKVLLAGMDAEQTTEYALRKVTVPRLGIPDGVYLFKDGDSWSAMVAALGGGTGTRWSGRLERCEDSHDAVVARQWFYTLWDSAVPVGPRPVFEPGAVVRLIGSDEVGDVVGPPVWSGERYAYTVRFGTQQKTALESSLDRVDLDSQDPETWVDSPPADCEDVALRLSHLKLTHGLSDTLYSVGSSKTVFRAYQFKPVLRLLNSPHNRLLIADEVGLGKTIEAGLIWTELDQRSELNRVLVVCPSMLVSKWRDEMRRRFGRTLRVLDRMGLEELADLFLRGDDQTPLHGVVSLERLRISEQLERLQAARPAFDLVVVDEAHYLRNPDTASHDVGELLSDWADALLFLSATPLNLGQSDLFSLMNLMLPAEFPDELVFAEQLAPNEVLTEVARLLRRTAGETREARSVLDRLTEYRFGSTVAGQPAYRSLLGLLDSAQRLRASELAAARRHLAELHTLSNVVTRTRKVDVPEDKAVREPRTIEVEWSPEEALFYDTVRRWAQRRAKAKGVPPGFAMQMPLRQTASCIPAMIQRLGEADIDDDFDELVDLEWDDADDEELPSDLVAALRRFAGQISGDTKFERFRAELDGAWRQGIRQFMVFSFFRRTLNYLRGRLTDQFRVAVMHGDVPVEEREQIMAAFRAGKIDILLLSEVGSEGLDFEFCNCLFNYDLPWNPMRVEQRIGRLDRFGQRHEKIFVYNFQVPGTIETDIFARLYHRLGVFQQSIGELEPILRDEFTDLQRVALDPRLSEQQRQAQLHRLEVAFEERSRQLDDIRESEAALAGLDQLLVDGLQTDMDRGRYIGPSELRRLLEALIAEDPGSKLDQTADAPVGTLTGTSQLSRMLLRSQRHGGASNYSLTELARLLNDGEPIPITFDSEVASQSGVELISVRHPLILTALDRLGDSHRMKLARFGRVRLVDGPRGRYGVVVYLREVTGLRPTRELWPVAVDLDTGKVVQVLGDALMAALARDGLRPDTRWNPPPLQAVVRQAQAQAVSELEALKSERQLSNNRTVDVRLTALRSEVEHKVARAEQTLGKVTEARIRRLHEGRIRNLHAFHERRAAELEAKRGVAVVLTPVAVIAARVGS